jgi:hypothetical protein
MRGFRYRAFTTILPTGTFYCQQSLVEKIETRFGDKALSLS